MIDFIKKCIVQMLYVITPKSLWSKIASRLLSFHKERWAPIAAATVEFIAKDAVAEKDGAFLYEDGQTISPKEIGQWVEEGMLNGYQSSLGPHWEEIVPGLTELARENRVRATYLATCAIRESFAC